MRIGGHSEGKDNVWVRKVLLLFWCSSRIESKSEEITFVRYMEYAPSLDALGKALRGLCLQWASESFAKKGLDVERERRDRDAVTACERYGAIPFHSLVSAVQVV